MINNLWPLLERYLSSGNILAYGVVFLAGILASFTPCVYPVIPITVAYLGAKGEGKRGRSFLRALFYVLGMALTYGILGAIAALTGKVFGQFSTSPAAYLFVGNVCLILGLSVFNVFTLPIPQFLRGRRLPTQKKGLFPSFLVGVSSGLILGPCTAPVLAVLLAYVGARAKVFFGLTLLFTFALGMGMLLLILGTFAGIAGRLPKSGPWLSKIEKFLGWALIFIGEYFIFMAGKLAV